MKIRSDFVSNSSSSSFIVIANDIGECKDLSQYNDSVTRKYIVPSWDGKCDFGWENVQTNDFFGKLNFCALQCYYSDNFEKYFDMLHDIVLEYFKLDIEMIKLKKEGKYEWLPTGMYIDHQSNASEGSCMEMFENEDNLLKFLSNDKSYIEGGNDNE